MKKVTIFAAMMLFVATQVSRSADRRNFWLLNRTGYQITSVYLAAHGTNDSWGSNVLVDGSTLANGVGAFVYFSGPLNACNYDFRIGYSDGAQQDYLQGRNLCGARAIQFNVDTNEELQ
jgi:hypothetical protein